MADIFEGVQLTQQQKDELATLRAGFKLVDQLTQDQKVGLDVKRRLRELNPNMNIRIPEDDIAEPLLKPVRERIDQIAATVEEKGKALDDQLAAIQTKTAEDEQKRKDDRDLRALESDIDKAAKHYRFTDEGRTALIEHMKSTNTSDPMTAGAYLVQNMEKPQPVASTGMASAEAIRNGAPNVDLFHLATGQTDDSLKMLHGSPQQRDRWMTNEINKVIEEGAAA